MKLDGSRIDEQPRNAVEALRALDAVADLLRSEGDPRAAFPDVYAVITRRVAEQVTRSDGGMYLEPEWISRLAGRFCEMYLETVSRSFSGDTQTCEAWKLAHHYGPQGASLPVQEALLGLSAHINYDLAIGIHDTIVEFGHAKDERMLARYKRDHDQVNEILHGAVYETLELLIERHRCSVTEVVYQRAKTSARWFAMFMLRQWRAQVWDTVLAMLNADTAEEREEIVEAMGRRAAWIGRAIVLPSAAYVAGRPLFQGARARIAALAGLAA
ncbi:DUF5995 family protein [Chondromyces apiculatus]|uniref:Uncharacterized protein n=1 Tax=Chondromyces apiculatus DSM 436 TaxID=1192034 RepID=A0A017T674_9BACT|nr:DUF5995 family protein [Chondromyces apiculatus]EYF04300.1 Hypothetical protein CAP_4644 [Chondromyces apiculatus DSM 436]